MLTKKQKTGKIVKINVSISNGHWRNKIMFCLYFSFQIKSKTLSEFVSICN